ncbi:MAG: flagellar motor protein MotB [Devosiaceae bacterium]|nr:flagellar motor protein MotB [Devosiaceae bacterium MH13]
MARKKSQAAGAPGWLVTFADLMSILVCFFVLIISFSIQDQQKLQVVAGSMRDAFGSQETVRRAGMIELEGAPLRDYVRRVGVVDTPEDSEFANERHDMRAQQGPEANTHTIEQAETEIPRRFATAAASLRQAWQDLPEITNLSQHIIIEENEDGLNISLVDQDGRSMFPEGSRYPYETTRLLLAEMAPVLRQFPYRIQITGHTAVSTNPPLNAAYTDWELSADRANAARRILQDYGIPIERFHSVVGRADSEPLFANDPQLPANRRISILLMREEPPIPHDHEL